ncbi:MAG: PqqD family protein [Gammaproteobacteria bacterium]|nr:PqqD family protein [Gammaproteobacteria bacterium]
MEFRYQLKNPGIIHELLDEEVILANLDNGIYYSIRGVGTVIWQMLMQGASPRHIANELIQHYGVSADSCEREVSQFLDTLITAELIMPAGDESLCSSHPFEFPKNYQSPIFEQYDDMKNLLMLDPIHEVDEQGWPSRAPGVALE